jgi:hypothetical protein
MFAWLTGPENGFLAFALVFGVVGFVALKVWARTLDRRQTLQSDMSYRASHSGAMGFGTKHHPPAPGSS